MRQSELFAKNKQAEKKKYEEEEKKREMAEMEADK